MRSIICITALMVALATPGLAQSVGLGGQIGSPTGVSLRIGSTGPAVDIAAGWNINNDHLFAQIHWVPSQIALGAAPATLRAFYGPGAYASVEGRQGRDDRARFGVSFNAGLSFWFSRVEVYGQLTPRLQLIDSTDFELGGALGLRYYF